MSRVSRPVLTAPVSHPSEVAPLLRAGVAELYCGVQPSDERARAVGVEYANRRDDVASNLARYDELDEVVRIARGERDDARIFLALNNYFTEVSFPLAIEQIERALEAGVDALILADPALVPEVRSRAPNLDLHLSSVAAYFNSEALAHCREQGFTRAILPRHLTEAEIASLVERAEGLELEVLVMNDGCHLVDGHCGFLHPIQQPPAAARLLRTRGLERALAPITTRIPQRWFMHMLEESDMLPCHLREEQVEVEVEGDGVNPDDVRAYHVRNLTASRVRYRCALCSLGALAAGGVHSLKLVGRRYPLSQKLSAVRSLRRALGYAESGMTGEPLVQACEGLFTEAHGFACERRYCYLAPGGARGVSPPDEEPVRGEPPERRVSTAPRP